jgi:hypothetical protein
MRLHRHDDPILRPGAGNGEGAGRNPDYDPHHGRRPAPRTHPTCRPNKPTGSFRGPISSHIEPRGASVCLRSAELCGLGGSLMDLLDCTEDRQGQKSGARNAESGVG